MGCSQILCGLYPVVQTLQTQLQGVPDSSYMGAWAFIRQLEGLQTLLTLRRLVQSAQMRFCSVFFIVTVVLLICLDVLANAEAA